MPPFAPDTAAPKPKALYNVDAIEAVLAASSMRLWQEPHFSKTLATRGDGRDGRLPSGGLRLGLAGARALAP